ncbi:MAG: ZIP family metal transporter [Nanoarchaeota archaeon]
MNIVYLFALVAFIFTLLGGFIALRFKRVLPYFFAFSAGSLISVSFLDLIPESIDIAESIGLNVKYVLLVTLLSFFLYMFLERFFMTHHHHDDEEHGHILGPIGAGSLVLHSFIDGLAVGSAFQINVSLGLVVAIAVISHDFTDGINTVTLMLKNRHSSAKAKGFLFAAAIAPVLGILVASAFAIPQVYLAFILAFFAGEFLYIGAGNLLPELKEHKSWKIGLFLLLGFLVIFGISLVA